MVSVCVRLILFAIFFFLKQKTAYEMRISDGSSDVCSSDLLFQAFAQARKKRGAIDFDTVETRIVCNPLGRIEKIEPYTRNDAHRLIEECMLAANTSAADFIVRNKRKPLSRVHDGPTPVKLQEQIGRAHV